MPTAEGIDAVLLDLFGTLVPVAPDVEWAEQMRMMAEPVGVPTDVFAAGFGGATRDRMTGTLTIPGCVRRICDDAGIDVDDSQVAESVAARERVLRGWLTPRDATMPALHRLRTAGFPLALVSDCSSDAVELWPTTPMAPLFTTAVLSAEMLTQKPDERMYLAACETLDVDPRRCLYVGDGNSNELTGAAAVGMRAVHLDAQRPANPAPDYEGATWTGERVTTLTEIPALLGC